MVRVRPVSSASDGGVGKKAGSARVCVCGARRVEARVYLLGQSAWRAGAKTRAGVSVNASRTESRKGELARPPTLPCPRHGDRERETERGGLCVLLLLCCQCYYDFNTVIFT